MAYLNEVLEYFESQVRRLEEEHCDAADKFTEIHRLEPFLACWRGFREAFKTVQVTTGPNRYVPVADDEQEPRIFETDD